MKLFIFILAFHHCTSYARRGFEYNFPFQRNIIYPFQTLGLVEFQSKDAKPVNVPPMRVNIIPNSLLQLDKLTGSSSSLRATPIGDEVPITLTGGVVFDDEYIIDQINYIVDGVANGHVGGIVDGESVPLEYAFLFRKKSYGTLENAQKYADGLVSLTIPIRVDEGERCDNFYFEPMEKILYQMRPPNVSRMYISTEEAFSWILNPLTRFNAFFAYPVTTQNFLNSTIPDAQCLIRVKPAVPRNQYLSISKRQFQEYLYVLDSNRHIITLSLPTFPLGERPLVKAYTQFVLTRNYY